MRVLGHASALISVKEYIVDIEGSGNKRLGVSTTAGFLVIASSVHLIYSPEALINSTEIKVDLYLVVLKSDEGYSETRVAAEPELKGNIESGLGKGLAGSTYLVRGIGSAARSINFIEFRVGDGKLSSVTYHLVVTTSLLGCE